MPEEPLASVARVALVTGGARGIGLGIARSLAAEGWALALNGVREEAAVAGVLDDLRAGGAEVLYCRGDVGEAADRAAMVEAVRAHFGRLHLLVNNAGITSVGRKDVLEATEESWDRVFAVNLKGPFFLSQLAANWMVEQVRADPAHRAAIINISSCSAHTVSTNRGDYCMTKAALGTMTQLYAARLAEFGIPVFEVQPGVIRSDMTAAVTAKYDRLFEEGLTLERRWGEPEDVGRAVAMLARGDLTYATGQVLRVDGGMTVRTL